MEDSPQRIFATQQVSGGGLGRLRLGSCQLFNPTPRRQSSNPNPPDSNPPTPTPNPSAQPLTQPPDLNPLIPTLTYHRCVANLPHQHCCKCLSDAYAQILGHIRMSHSLCGEFFMWRILGQPYILPSSYCAPCYVLTNVGLASF